MTSSNIFWSFGFLYWMASAIPVLYAQKCSVVIENCVCTVSDKTIVLTDCQNAIVNLPGLYNASNSKSLITIRDSTSVTLLNKWKDVPGNNTSKEMREVYLMMNNVEKVTIKPNTFDQLVINAVFREIKELELSDKSFLSCWGSVWLFNVVVPNNSLNSNAFSSSDLVVHNGVSFTVNARPKVTPRLKFSQIYEVSAKVYDLGIALLKHLFSQHLKQIPLQKIKLIHFFFYSDRNHHLCRAGADRSRHPDVNLLNDRGSQKIRFAIISVGKST
ncbi:hypothetical protein DAPPUDRAFT_94656 [Daphnia pulex]|uniref:Uncharacterized protein n=1 Tax=Daphnia pulex TaxID=6669 RepID=E9FSN6_DAPPU|nr:hypothetical protein DAPPUDRAFT_94656 [Daphnia pulex]|eukprot:EFX89794.1 hypothetical protein DAPPUDRAFT_94656 [Daphnia pulex]